MEEIIGTLDKTAAVPTLVLFFTDGGFHAKAQITALMRTASALPAFWQFIGIGKSSFGVLEKLDNLTGRLVDNAGFFAVENVDTLSDAACTSCCSASTRTGCARHGRPRSQLTPEDPPGNRRVIILRGTALSAATSRTPQTRSRMLNCRRRSSVTRDGEGGRGAAPEPENPARVVPDGRRKRGANGERHLAKWAVRGCGVWPPPSAHTCARCRRLCGWILAGCLARGGFMVLVVGIIAGGVRAFV